MIIDWKVENFKSIQDETELQIAPLTIFAGTNNSGKSTFMQSILLVAQTLENKIEELPIVLNGSKISLGKYEDLKSNNSRKRAIGIKCTISPFFRSEITQQENEFAGKENKKQSIYADEKLLSVTSQISFSKNSLGKSKTLKFDPKLNSSSITCRFISDGQINFSNISISDNKIESEEYGNQQGLDSIDEKILQCLKYVPKLDYISRSEINTDIVSAIPIGTRIQSILPQKIICKFDTLKVMATSISGILQNTDSGRIYRNMIHNSEIPLSKELLNFLDVTIQNGNTNSIDPKFFQKLKRNKSEVSLLDLENQLNKYRTKSKLIFNIFNKQNQLIEKILKVLKEADSDQQFNFRPVETNLPNILVESTDYIESFFTKSVKYLGPLRDSPKAVYPISTVHEMYDIGLLGESTASVFDFYRNEPIDYISTSNFENSKITQNLTSTILESAVVDWLNYLGE